MKCKRKMQKRRDVLTVIGMMILLAFILRMWPILLLMLIGVFFYALWMLFHMDAAPQQPAQAPLMAWIWAELYDLCLQQSDAGP